MSHYVHILESERNGRYYIGRSQNPENRLQHHNTTSTGFTSRYRRWKLAFQQEFEGKENVGLAEKLIKSWKSGKVTRCVIEGKLQLEERIEQSMRVRI